MTGLRKSIIVTGGANGIGLAMTRHFASEGHQIAVVDINASTGPQVVEGVAKEYPKSAISFHACDCSSWSDQAAVFKKVFQDHGRLDIVMANAGIADQRTANFAVVLDGEPERPDTKVVDINLFGVLYTIKLAIHYMAKSSVTNDNTATRGSIIATASNAGIYPFPVAPLYAATKAGVIGLVRSLARPLTKLNIQINALAPAVLDTNIAPELKFATTMVVTPFTTLTRGVAQFISDPSMTGQVAEIHGDSVTISVPQIFVDEDTEKNIETFWSLANAAQPEPSNDQHD